MARSFSAAHVAGAGTSDDSTQCFCAGPAAQTKPWQHFDGLNPLTAPHSIAFSLMLAQYEAEVVAWAFTRELGKDVVSVMTMRIIGEIFMLLAFHLHLTP